VSFLVILANAVIVGIRQDQFMRDALSGDSHEYEYRLAGANEMFLCLLLLEVSIRIIATRWKYFFGAMWQWNVLDLLLAAWAVLGLFQDRICLLYVRLLRFFRLVRLLRVSNTVWLRDLRLMACTLLQSLVSVFWAFVLLFVVMYCFGTCFMQGVSNYFEQERHRVLDHLEVSERIDSNRRLEEFYGSLPKTLYTLLVAITNGEDWKTLADPLGEVHVAYQCMFAMYVVLVLIGALNVLTSVFVERARELSMLDRDLATQAELASQEAFIVEMRRIFEDIDEVKDGMITWQKFRDYLQNEQAQAFFSTQALDTSDAAGLFSLLDKDEKGEIRIEDFALGCMRLRGQAKSSEVATLLRESRKTSKKLMMEIRYLKDQIELMQVEYLGAENPVAPRWSSVLGAPPRRGFSTSSIFV
jgi:hypothetical protein